MAKRRWPVDEDADHDLVLDAGDAGTWTIQGRGERVLVSMGAAAKPTAVVRADPQTLAEILEGKRSGVDTWLKGFLFVRGSIALTMKLEGLVRGDDAPAHFPMPARVKAADIDTFYLDAGRGPAVVLLHGLGATNASMLTTLQALARDHRVIAPDLPGFGDSAKPVRAYHAGFFARWAVALLDRLGIERAHFIGNSMGGRISIEVGLRHPDRVDKLALFAPAVAFRKLRQMVPMVRMLRPELGALPIPLPRAPAYTVLRQIFSKPDRLPDAWYDAAIDEFMRVFSTPRGRIAFFSAARQIYLDSPWGSRGFWKRLATLERPSLFIWGDRDILVPAAFHKHVSRTVPHARSVVLKDCGHVPHFELPDETHALVRELIDSD